MPNKLDNSIASRLKTPVNGYYKWVCVNGRYRFAHGEIFSHSDLVAVDETALSAGSVFVFENGWRINESYSSTLKVGMKDDDAENLQKIINKPRLVELEH